MRINIKVFPKSSRNDIVDESGGLKVYVTAAADKGKANKAAIELLSKKFKVSKSRISIIMGQKNRKKIVEVSGL